MNMDGLAERIALLMTCGACGLFVSGVAFGLLLAWLF